MSTRAVDAWVDFAPAAKTPGKFTNGVVTVFKAIGEGFAANRRYHELVGRGVPAKRAASIALNELDRNDGRVSAGEDPTRVFHDRRDT